jgi:hypothetical protein
MAKDAVGGAEIEKRRKFPTAVLALIAICVGEESSENVF